MKYLKLIILLIVVTSYSCEDLDINENPNKVQETHPSLLLTNIAKNAFQVQGKGPMYASRMMVSTDGESSEQYFKWNSNSFGNYNNLRQVTKMIEEANRVSEDSYIAIGHFFRAYYFYNLTLTFGDIPYEEALKGETEQIYLPKYSSQEKVFEGILNELKTANELLKSGDIITGDPIFGGQTGMWKKLINSFRLKVLMTLSKKEGVSSLNIKNNFASIFSNEDIISSPAESARINFVDVVDSRYTEFNSSSYNSGLYMASTLVDMMKDRKDPRLFAIASQTKEGKENGLSIDNFNSYQGGNPIVPYNDVNLLAAQGKVSKVNSRYSQDPTNEAHNLLGYSEVQFILAEAVVRGWINGDANTFYKNAVKANFEFYNVYAKGYDSFYTESKANEYLSQDNVKFSNANSMEERLELIITQKYLTSFLQGGWRMYFDYLRTGYPNLPYLSPNTPPLRWSYPLDEYLKNSDNVREAIKRQFQGIDGTRKMTWWLKQS